MGQHAAGHGDKYQQGPDDSARRHRPCRVVRAGDAGDLVRHRHDDTAATLPLYLICKQAPENDELMPGSDNSFY